jgi:hypothetical protein
MNFTATEVEAGTDAAVANVLFADPETNPDEPSVLMFSRSIESQDSEYYFEINDQSYGRYGGLASVRLSRNNLEVQLEPGVVKDFGNENFAKVRVEFEIDDEAYHSVLETLGNIFANTNIMVVA